MPTYEYTEEFMREYQKLSLAQRELFDAARRALVYALKHGVPFPQRLRIRELSGHSGIYELTWDYHHDGRATFAYGPEQRSGERHVMWRRIGGHEIFKQP